MTEFTYNNEQHLSTGRSSFLISLRRYLKENKESTQKIQKVNKFV